jgi:ABC-type multidrug transport system fused ATPase/permease subunit
VLGIGTTVFSYFQVSFWSMTAERQIKRLRHELFKAILKQNIGWYDVYKSGELTNRMTE